MQTPSSSVRQHGAVRWPSIAFATTLAVIVSTAMLISGHRSAEPGLSAPGSDPIHLFVSGDASLPQAVEILKALPPAAFEPMAAEAPPSF